LDSDSEAESSSSEEDEENEAQKSESENSGGKVAPISVDSEDEPLSGLIPSKKRRIEGTYHFFSLFFSYSLFFLEKTRHESNQKKAKVDSIEGKLLRGPTDTKNGSRRKSWCKFPNRCWPCKEFCNFFDGVPGAKDPRKACYKKPAELRYQRKKKASE